MKKNKKYAIVCGGSYGLGLEITKFFVEKKINTIIIARKKKNMLKAINKLNSNLVSSYTCDLSKSLEVDKFFEKLKKKGIKINFLICNAGNGKDEFSKKNNHKNFHKAYEKNFFTAINPIEIIVNKKNYKNLKIIVISSIAGYFKGNAPLSYSLAKNSLINYCKYVSKELAAKNIRINSISPGHIFQKNNLWYQKYKKNKFITRKFINDNVALKKFCYPRDIINTINFLISDQSNYITGIDLKVDGNTN